MNVKTILGAAALALISAAPASAVPIDLDFSFGDVSGTFIGLDNAQATSNATSVVFDGALDSYAFDASLASRNSFLFEGGELQYAHFVFAGAVTGSSSFDFLLSAFTLHAHGAAGVMMMSTEMGIDEEANRMGLPTFTQVSAVPLPAGGLLLLSGFAGLAAVRRNKKRAA